MKLRLSDDLTLPVEVATQTTLVVGKRGSGKSTTAARIVEQLLKAKVPVAVLDPVDAWWGLKADGGGGAGHSVYVFGGRHADLPLEAGAGAVVAEFLCEHRAPLVLSCKHFSGLERSRFMVDFAMTLFRKWTGGVLHLVLEEAHELAPQAPPKGEKAEEMLGAFKRLWKLGRSSGIGGTAVTQRPASLSKDITTQSEILVVHRTIGPQDVEAVRQWIKYHHEGEEILPELATLKTGEAFVWAPEFPEDKPIGLRRVQILPRETFDSASTPKPGEQPTEPKELAPVDLERLKSRMASTIERAKADDPKELRKKIADLTKQLAAKPAVSAPKAEVRTVDVPILKDSQLSRLESSASRFEKIAERAAVSAEQHQQIAANARAAAQDIRQAIVAAKAPVPMTRGPVVPQRRVAPAPAVERAASTRSSTPSPALGKSGKQRMLVALAQNPDGLTSTKLSILTGISQSGGTWRTYLSELRGAGWVEGGGEFLRITASGLAELGDYEPLPTGEDLIRYWQGRLGNSGKRSIFDAVVAAYPDSLTYEAVSNETGISLEGGTWRTYLSELRGLELIVGTRGELRASDALFEGAAN